MKARFLEGQPMKARFFLQGAAYEGEILSQGQCMKARFFFTRAAYQGGIFSYKGSL